MKIIYYLVGLLIAFSLFICCVSSAGEGVDKSDKESHFSSSASDILIYADESIKDPYQFSKPFELHPPYKKIKFKEEKNLAQFFAVPLMVQSSKLLDQGRNAYFRRLLKQFSSVSSSLNKKFSNLEIIPYEVSSNLLDIYIEEKSYIADLPLNQWVAGMLGGDFYLEFGFDEFVLGDTMKVTFYCQSVMTGTGQVLSKRESESAYSLLLDKTKLEEVLNSSFSNFYEEMIFESAHKCSQLLEGGRFCQLQVKNISSSFDRAKFLQSYQENFYKVVPQKYEKNAIILNIWTKKSDLEFETLFFNIINGLLDQNSHVELLEQDRISFVYKVELLDGHE